MKTIIEIVLCTMIIIGISGCSIFNNGVELTEVNNAKEVFNAMLKSKSMPDSSDQKCKNVERKNDLWSSKVYWNDSNVESEVFDRKNVNLGGTIETFDDISYLKLRKKYFEVANETVDETFGKEVLGDYEKKLCDNLKQYTYVKGNVMLRLSHSVGKATAKEYKNAFFECLKNYKYNHKTKVSSEDYTDAENKIIEIGETTITDLSADVYQKYYDQADSIDKLISKSYENGWNKKSYAALKKAVKKYNIGLLSDRHKYWIIDLEIADSALHSKKNKTDSSNKANEPNKSNNETFLDVFGKDNCIDYAKQSVNYVLKSPSSAEYPGSFFNPYEGWNIYSEDNQTIVVESYVDSQNSFGAMIRTNFTVKIIQTGESQAGVKYLKLGNHVYVNK